MSNTPPIRGERWHIGKEIPLAIVFAIFAQSGGMVWWAATLTGKIDTLSEKVIVLQADKRVQEMLFRDVAVIQQRMTSNERQIAKNIVEIEKLYDNNIKRR